MAKANPRAARERKQKIFVAVGGLLLLALLAFQLPKILGGSSTEASATTEATLAGESTTPGSVVPSTAIPTSLVDTGRRIQAGPGQLRSFGVFGRKDPFVQQLETPDSAPGGDSGGSAAGNAGSGGAKGGDEASPTADFSTDDPAAPAVTVISVNGTRQALAAGAVFPAADPVFVLIAENAKAKTVVVGIAGGSYANGAGGTKLKVGKPLILVNTSTGARYRLVLIAVGEGGPAAKPAADSDKP